MVSSGSLWRLRFSQILSPALRAGSAAADPARSCRICPTGRGARSANGGFRSPYCIV